MMCHFLLTHVLHFVNGHSQSKSEIACLPLKRIRTTNEKEMQWLPTMQN
jgi:hypothetical protein